jgi:hypothetical protein
MASQNGKYAVLVASNVAALVALADDKGWKLLPNTGYAFTQLTSDDDLSLNFIDGRDGIATDDPGVVALAYRDG